MDPPEIFCKILKENFFILNKILFAFFKWFYNIKYFFSYSQISKRISLRCFQFYPILLGQI